MELLEQHWWEKVRVPSELTLINTLLIEDTPGAKIG